MREVIQEIFTLIAHANGVRPSAGAAMFAISTTHGFSNPSAIRTLLRAGTGALRNLAESDGSNTLGAPTSSTANWSESAAERGGARKISD
jgi:hypothetical protein